MDSKAPVVIIVAIILMGVLLWGVWAVRMAGGVSPERKKTLAEEAERECVLDGLETDTCKRLVGENHRDCLDRGVAESESAALDEETYHECMSEAFAEAETSGKEKSDAGADGGAETGTADDAAERPDAEGGS